MEKAAPSEHESIIAIGELPLVRELLNQPRWTNQFLSLHGVPANADLHPEVNLSGLNARGDIDVLAVAPARPEHAVAFQVKRIKVAEHTFATEMVSGLSSVAELHRQSNLLVQLGFWQVFSIALIVVDARSRNDGKLSFNDLTPNLRQKIDAALTLEGLHKDAGFVSFGMAQTAGAPFTTGTHWGRVHRMPVQRRQTSHVTEWVKRLWTP